MKSSKESEISGVGRIKMVLMFDEGKMLVDLHLYNAFRWVLDVVVERAWKLTRPPTTVFALPFMAIFLGTNSKVAELLPPDEDCSARYYTSKMAVPPPFTALEWDTHVNEPAKSISYNDLRGMTWLSRFGRPMWRAHWSLSMAKSVTERLNDAEAIIEFAEKKLHHLHSTGGFRRLFIEDQALKNYIDTKGPKDFLLSCSAILGVLAVLDMDFTAPSNAAELVASRLRWAAGCDKKRSYLLTTYASEPIVAEAAFRLLFATPSSDAPDKVLVTVLKQILEPITNGDYDVGSDGEFAARLICKYLLVFILFQVSSHGDVPFKQHIPGS
jgi:hypothetical protein